MKAKKKPILTLKPEDIGIDFVRRQGRFLSSFAQERDSRNSTISVLPTMIDMHLNPFLTSSQSPRMEVLSVSEPPKRVGGGKVSLMLLGDF